MSIELQALFGVAALMLILISIQGGMTPIIQGLRWGLGPRDDPRDQSVFQGRMKRIIANHIEGVAMFAPLVVIAHLAGVSTPLTQAGAMLFLGGRALFALVYMMGVPVVRTLVWAAAMTGLVMVGVDVVRFGF